MRMKIVAILFVGFLCAGCVSARKYEMQSSETKKYKLLSEDLTGHVARLSAERNKLSAEKAALEKRLDYMETSNKILNETLTNSRTPSKMTLEKAMIIWKQALEKLPTP